MPLPNIFWLAPLIFRNSMTINVFELPEIVYIIYVNDGLTNHLVATTMHGTWTPENFWEGTASICDLYICLHFFKSICFPCLDLPELQLIDRDMKNWCILVDWGLIYQNIKIYLKKKNSMCMYINFSENELKRDIPLK